MRKQTRVCSYIYINPDDSPHRFTTNLFSSKNSLSPLQTIIFNTQQRHDLSTSNERVLLIYILKPLYMHRLPRHITVHTILCYNSRTSLKQRHKRTFRAFRAHLFFLETMSSYESLPSHIKGISHNFENT